MLAHRPYFNPKIQPIHKSENSQPELPSEVLNEALGREVPKLDRMNSQNTISITTFLTSIKELKLHWKCNVRFTFYYVIVLYGI